MTNEHPSRSACYDMCFKMLSFKFPGSPSQGREQLERVIRRGLSRKDKTFHYMCYEYILSTLDSSWHSLIISSALPLYMESFLADGATKKESVVSTWSKKDRAVMLYKVLEAHEERGAAALVADALSQLNDPSLTLSHRIEFLMNAISNARLCGGIAGAGFDAGRVYSKGVYICDSVFHIYKLRVLLYIHI
jgi:hypothetical protein